MSPVHLTMEQLLAVRDGDRSEPAFADAHQHATTCPQCTAEVERLHQRTARLRALPTLAPAANHFPAIKAKYLWDRSQRRRHVAAFLGFAAAAAMLVSVVGRDLVQPPRLDAEEQIANAMSSSQQLEQTLRQWKPDDRVIDGRTAQMVIQLEDRIAQVDVELTEAATLSREARLQRELQLWQQRVGLMNALVDVHVTKAANVDL